MTTEERQITRGLVVFPVSGAQLSKEEFVRRFPSAVESGKLALRLLEGAYKSKNAEDLECALVIGHTFGFGSNNTAVLCNLVEADWHVSHEDVVSALDTLRTPVAVEALFSATQWIPKYLEFDESRAMAVKAIWGLGNIAGNEAGEKLETLACCDDPILRQNAADQLKRRRKIT